MSQAPEARVFDAYYFQHSCGRPYSRSPEWLQFFDAIAERIVREIEPRTVLDAGCAMGFLVEALRGRGVEAFGLDISEYAISHVREDLKPYCRVGSVIDPTPRRYDLVVCIEVLEHLSPPDGERAIAQICRATEDVLFSSTPLDYREATHFNVQPPEYWSDLFAAHGYVRDVDFDAAFITPWAARFRLNRDPWRRVLRDYERRFWVLWKENADLRGLALELRNQVAADERTVQTLQAQVARQQQQLDDVTRSPSWRLAQFLQRTRLAFAPPGSRRVRMLDRIVERFSGDRTGR